MLSITLSTGAVINSVKDVSDRNGKISSILLGRKAEALLVNLNTAHMKIHLINDILYKNQCHYTRNNLNYGADRIFIVECEWMIREIVDKINNKLPIEIKEVNYCTKCGQSRAPLIF